MKSTNKMTISPGFLKYEAPKGDIPHHVKARQSLKFDSSNGIQYASTIFVMYHFVISRHKNRTQSQNDSCIDIQIIQ